MTKSVAKFKARVLISIDSAMVAIKGRTSEAALPARSTREESGNGTI